MHACNTGRLLVHGYDAFNITRSLNYLHTLANGYNKLDFYSLFHNQGAIIGGGDLHVVPFDI